MLKIAGKIIDSYDDPAFLAHPDLKSSGLPSLEDLDRMPDRDFALVIKTAAGRVRKFPVGSADQVRVSAAYFKKSAELLPEDIQKVAASGISTAADKFSMAVSIPKMAAYPSNEVILKEYRDDSFEVGLDKQAAVKRAEDELIAHYGRMTPLERALAANDLNKVAEVSDARIYDYVIKDRIGPNIDTGIRQRMTHLSGDPVKTASLTCVLQRMKSVDPGRAAIMLHQFDKLANYSGEVLDAFRTCWGGFTKAAEAIGSVMDYKIMTLARAHGEEISRVFARSISEPFLRDPLGYYKTRAKGQVKALLTDMANQVGKKNPSTEIRRDQVAGAKEAIRSGDFTPWSKTLMQLRSV